MSTARIVRQVVRLKLDVAVFAKTRALVHSEPRFGVRYLSTSMNPRKKYEVSPDFDDEDEKQHQKEVEGWQSDATNPNITGKYKVSKNYTVESPVCQQHQQHDLHADNAHHHTAAESEEVDAEAVQGLTGNEPPGQGHPPPRHPDPSGIGAKPDTLDTARSSANQAVDNSKHKLDHYAQHHDETKVKVEGVSVQRNAVMDDHRSHESSKNDNEGSAKEGIRHRASDVSI